MAAELEHDKETARAYFEAALAQNAAIAHAQFEADGAQLAKVRSKVEGIDRSIDRSIDRVMA